MRTVLVLIRLTIQPNNVIVLKEHANQNTFFLKKLDFQLIPSSLQRTGIIWWQSSRNKQLSDQCRTCLNFYICKVNIVILIDFNWRFSEVNAVILIDFHWMFSEVNKIILIIFNWMFSESMFRWLWKLWFTKQEV